MSDAVDVPSELEGLVHAWCDRRELNALALLLPAYLSNNGLTDGWAAVMEALHDLRSIDKSLPPEEADQIRRIIPVVEQAVYRT